MNPLRIVRYTAWAALAALAILAGVVLLAPKSADNLGAGAVGGPFVMDSTLGAPVDRENLKGKPYAVFFGFTQCPDICPTTMFELSQNLKALGDKAKDFRIYFVTVDPERDTLGLLKQYLSAFDPRIIGLVPKDAAQLAQVAKSFHVFYRKVPTPSGYTMDHSAAVLLFDKNGRWAGTVDAEENQEARLAKLTRLLQG